MAMRDDDLIAYCSWCFRKTRHKLVEDNWTQRNIYECRSCKSRTLECRYCAHMAKGGDLWDDECCAEHDGEIASFENLGMKLADIEDFEQLFDRDAVNMVKAGKYAAAIVGGATVFGPAALLAAPSLAASLGATGLLGAAGTGTAISTLSGAALTNASLAAVGGGTMAAGAIVVTAAGASLGGYYGGVVSNKYFGEVDHFDIRKLKSGTKHGVIFVNGFLSQANHDTSDWTTHLEEHFKRHSWYHVDWEAENLRKLGRMIISAPRAAGVEFAKSVATRALKAAPKKIGPLALISNVADLASNPWHSGMVKAQKTGAMLADAIARTPGWTFTLAGHSLGARVAYYALEILSTQRTKKIENVYLLGGAVGRGDDEGWRKAASAIKGKNLQLYSRNDDTLGYLYRGANLLLSEPIGYDKITFQSSKIHNFDCTALVNGHMEWKDWFGEILTQLRE